DVNRALHLFPLKESGWQPKVKTASAYYNQGIDKIWDMIQSYFELTKSNDYFEQNRTNQNLYWLKETVQEHLLNSFYQNEEIKKNTKSPFAVANELLALYKRTISL